MSGGHWYPYFKDEETEAQKVYTMSKQQKENFNLDLWVFLTVTVQLVDSRRGKAYHFAKYLYVSGHKLSTLYNATSLKTPSNSYKWAPFSFYKGRVRSLERRGGNQVLKGGFKAQEKVPTALPILLLPIILKELGALSSFI